MKTIEFLAWRTRELEEFFLTRFGPSWRRLAARRVGRNAPIWWSAKARGPMRFGTLQKLENLALLLGWRAKPLPPERNYHEPSTEVPFYQSPPTQGFAKVPMVHCRDLKTGRYAALPAAAFEAQATSTPEPTAPA